ncbi:glycosyltransferase family 2 protein [Bifidobacterium sp. 6T3]|uniref:Glycosyltransferase family 2 protein n=1 Tax=Bifidobacterium phasiani TaxID=2834431 RepID=A0ABS6W7Y2_9BIFI|nr:glycosyltransferase family 2 protein [Bifidobacterium phasiani]MBW3082615.1 glycosyltransferase family 2 protein [Bifidobacterium phasiani]
MHSDVVSSKQSTSQDAIASREQSTIAVQPEGDPAISIIVPVYNVKDYLRACVDSVLRQTFDDFELILVDDGSTDGSGDLCEDLCELDDRIICLHKKNGGLSDARNYGIERMRGTYVTFIDSDDWVESTYLEYLHTNIQLQDSDVSTCIFMMQCGDMAKPWKQLPKKPVMMTGHDALLSMLYGESVNVSAHGKLYRSKLFNDVRYPVGKRYEDVGTTYKLLHKAKSVAVGGAPLYNYVMRQGSITHEGSKGIFDRYQLARQAYSNLKRYDYDIAHAARRYLTFHELSVLKSFDRDDFQQKARAIQIKQDVLKHCKTVFGDARTPRKDKIAICILFLGFSIYQWSWNVYTRFVQRGRQ